jgi:thiol-disulfide isomerase/thioredoxin/YHS domain-containing protein
MQSRLVRMSLVVVAALGSAMNAMAAIEGGVLWIDDPEVAARESTRTGKPILMQVTAKWCGYCHKMFRETYADPAIVNSANNDFICLRVDADKNKKLVDQIGVKALPTTVVLTPGMRVVKKLTGYQSVSRLGATLRETRMLARQTPGRTRVTSEPTLTPQTTQPVSPQRAQPPLTRTVERPSIHPRVSARVEPSANPFEQLEMSAAARTTQSATTRDASRSVSDSRTVPDAFEKMCLVTLFDDRRIETGSLEFSSTHRNRNVYFTSAAAKARFDARPDRYWPTLDGHCVVTYLEGSGQVKGNPVYGAVFRQRMWFFRSAEQMETFIANPQEYLPQQPTPRT